jgi:uncharacterized membrane protein
MGRTTPGGYDGSVRERSHTDSGRAATAFDRVRTAALSPLVLAVLSAAIVVLRYERTQLGVGPMYDFIGLNLFLAWVPRGLAYGISLSARTPARWFALAGLGVLWILFLPNAPYLVTDLVHLQEGVGVVNVALLSLLALNGILLGVKSVQLFQRTVDQLLGPAVAWRAVQVVAVLTSVGIYVGRVLRWNSWTVLHDPEILVRALLRTPSEPGRAAFALLATVLASLAFLIIYRLLGGPGTLARARRMRTMTTS